MDIDDLTIGQARMIADMFGSASKTGSPHIGKVCVIRTYASGVHVGTLVSLDGRQVDLEDARRLWLWHALSGISLSDVAVYGIDAAKSRVCATVPCMTVLDALEVIPASAAAIKSIMTAQVADQ